MRYKYSDSGMRERVKSIRAMSNLSVEEQNSAIEALWEKQKQSHLPGFVTYLREYTNGLAGKKALSDRTTEHGFGRAVYSVSKALEGRVAANMVALNPASWLTNFIPLTQAGDVKTKNLLRGMWDALAQHGKNASDELRTMIDGSDFLSGRRGSQPLARTGLEKMQDALTAPMGWIDDFTSSAIVRAKYLDNMEKGMAHADALQSADDYAGRLIADRSKGMLPTMFNMKNPVAKIFTMYQVEVNNQFSFLFKDLPKQETKHKIRFVASALTKYAVGAYIYNDVYERLVGRRPAFDPLGIANEAIGDVTGTQLPNTAELIPAVKNASHGDMSGFSTGREISWKKTGINLAENIAGNTPFIGGLLNGGRVPISSAIPNVENIWSAASGWADGNIAQDAAKNKIWKEIIKPATFLLPPIGGGQAKKTLEGLDTMRKGGLYGLNNSGEQQLKFMVDPTLENYVKSTLFGQYATKDAQEYIKSGFQPALSVKETEALKRSGVEPRAFLDLAIQLRAQRTEKDAEGKTLVSGMDKKRNLLLKSNITPEQKAILDHVLLSQGDTSKSRNYISQDEFILSGLSESNRKLWNIPKVAQMVGDTETFEDILEAVNQVKAEKDSNGNTVAGSAEDKKIRTIAQVMGSNYADAHHVYDELFINKHTIEEFSSKDREHFERVSSVTGMQQQEFIDCMNVLRNVSAGDAGNLTQARMDALVTAGYAPTQAHKVVQDLFETKYTVDDLSESSVEAFNRMNTKYEISEAGFLNYYNQANSVQGVKNTNGKTVSGSQKKARFQALVKMEMDKGLSQDQAHANAKAFLMEVYGYKDAGWS